MSERLKVIIGLIFLVLFAIIFNILGLFDIKKEDNQGKILENTQISKENGAINKKTENKSILSDIHISDRDNIGEIKSKIEDKNEIKKGNKEDLAIIKKKQVGENIWSIMAPYNIKKEKIQKYDGGDCGGMDPIFPECSLRIESPKGTTYFPGFRGKLEVIGNRVIAQTQFGDGCGSNKDYVLFDKFGKKLNSLETSYSGCYSENTIYSQGNISLEFVDIDENNNYKEDYFNQLIIKNKGKIIQSYVYEHTLFTFDIKNNLLNKDKIEYGIGNKKNIITLSDFKNNEIDNINQLILSLKKKNDTYLLRGYLEYFQGVQEISILSCKSNNSKEYDTNWYKLNKYIPGDRTFTYNISEKYNNKCDIPYKIKIKSNIKNKTQELIGEYTLIFNK